MVKNGYKSDFAFLSERFDERVLAALSAR